MKAELNRLFGNTHFRVKGRMWTKLLVASAFLLAFAISVHANLSYAGAAQEYAWGSIRGKIAMTDGKVSAAWSGPLYVYVLDPTAIHPSMPQDRLAVEKLFREKFESRNGISFDRWNESRSFTMPDKDAPPQFSVCVAEIHSAGLRPDVIMLRAGEPAIVLNYTSGTHLLHLVSATQVPEGELKIRPGSHISMRFKADRQPLELFCTIHPKEQLIVFVQDHPYFTQVADNGEWQIRDVPAGETRLIITDGKHFFGSNGHQIVRRLASANSVVVEPGRIRNLGTISLIPRP